MKDIKSKETILAVCEHIKRMLLHGAYVPGQKLILRELSEKLNTSQTTVIKALNQLVSEDILTYISNRGFSIKNINIEDIEKLYEIRLVLERLNIKNCIKKRTLKSIKYLDEAFNKFLKYNPEIIDGNKILLDFNFHRTIAFIGENEYATKYTDIILSQIVYKYRIENAIEQNKKKINDDHNIIYNYIKNGDLKNSLKEIKIHIEDSKNVMIKYYKDFQKNLDKY